MVMDELQQLFLSVDNLCLGYNVCLEHHINTEIAVIQTGKSPEHFKLKQFK